MRIALITSWPTDVVTGSGTAVFFNAFTEGLRSRGYDLDVIAPGVQNVDLSDYVQMTLQRFLFNTDLCHDPRLKTADIIFGFDYDGYGLDPNNRAPFIASGHTVYGDVVQWESDPVRTMVEAQAFFDRIAMQRADLVTIGSQYAKDRIVALYGIAAEKIRVIPHGMVTPSWFKYLKPADQIAANDHPVILAVGKMYPRKRIGILLQAVAILQAKYPTLEARIIGDGLEWDMLHALADQLGINDHITWLSRVEDDAAFAREWQQADVFCHPSNQETFGYVYLEAMTLGKPIVAVCAGAAPEVLGDAALLAEPENPEALAYALSQFLDSPALRQEYGQRARERASRYTLNKMIDGYVSVINSVRLR